LNVGAAIELHGLTKSYGRRRGIVDVDLVVQRGEVFGFLGPNGAGKTTAIRLLLDILRPDAGEAVALGLNCRTQAVDLHRRIGYLPGEAGMQERQRVRDYLRDMADLQGGSAAANIEKYARAFGLDLAGRLRSLSKGNKQKVGLVQALMHEPELLILDEPTSGLDPLMQQRFHDVVKQAKAQGRTVFLSSHVMSEVEVLCDRVAIIREGRILAVATVEELKRRAPRALHVRLADACPPQRLAGLPGLLAASVEGKQVHARFTGPAGPILDRLHPYGIQDVTSKETSLEDVFMAYYREGRA
jgi:ABC-2 type transport system ATP-binding protein